ELKRRYAEEGKDPALVDKLYNTDHTGEKIARVLQMAAPIKEQLGRDTVLEKNNELREKMEMWYVYEKLQKGGKNSIRKEKKGADQQLKAWSKLQRIKKLAMQKGGIYVEIADWAAEAAQQLMERVSSKTPLTRQDQDFVREKMAAIVLNQVFIREMKKYDSGEGEGYYALALRKRSQKEVYLKMAKELANSKEFQKTYAAYMKGGADKEKCMAFLAQDIEKEWAKKVPPKQMQPVAAHEAVMRRK
ncbi:MAG: hypothetical protein J6P60_02710, partial [Lachnospiraceae bacterium]|nr:hypothetical protein [Lachnospiraceae bacterium]